MRVEDAVKAELEQLNASTHAPALAAVALTLAVRLDEAATRDSAPIARELRESLTKVRAVCEKAKPEGSRLDDLAARRAARIADTEDSERPAEGEHGGR